MRSERPQLMLLNLVLPGADGIELMAEVAELADLPVIVVSAYGRDETITRAFEAGAADYLVKPFSATGLAIDYARRRVTVDGRAVALATTEYEIVRILSVNAGRVVTSQPLLQPGLDDRDPSDTERVRAFVSQIRAMLGDDAAEPAWIFNERGVGYRMPAPGEE